MRTRMSLTVISVARYLYYSTLRTIRCSDPILVHSFRLPQLCPALLLSSV